MGLLGRSRAMPSVVLEGSDIYLRPPQRRDSGDWVEVRSANRTFLKPWTPLSATQTINRKDFSRRLAHQTQDWHDNRGRAFLIFQRENNQLIGGINVTQIIYGVAMTGMLGYWMSQEYNGRGHMTEAVLMVADYCFGAMALHRLQAAVMPHNVASRRVLEKAGFREEGYAPSYLRIAGKWEDHVLYGLVSTPGGPV